MYTLGINLSHHSSIALLKDNQVLLFVQEERLNREKYYQGVPLKALELVEKYTRHIDCLLMVGSSPDNLSETLEFLKTREVKVEGGFRVNHLHHVAHAAAGFYMSHFDDATIIVVDGAGAIYRISKDGMRASETTSFYKGSFPSITCTHKHFVIGIYDTRPFIYDNNDVIAFRQRFSNIPISVSERFDIGWKYADVTARIGFGVFGEGKTMGLSAYGGLPEFRNDIKVQRAHGIQKHLERHFLSLASKVTTPNLVLSGGCALNILANSLIKKNYPHLNIYVDPIAADGTTALGIAAFHYYNTTRSTDKLVFTGYDGPSYSLNRNYIYECARKYSI